MLSVESSPAKHVQGLMAEVWSAGFCTNILVAVHISCSLGSEQRSILADCNAIKGSTLAVIKGLTGVACIICIVSTLSHRRLQLSGALECISDSQVETGKVDVIADV